MGITILTPTSILVESNMFFGVELSDSSIEIHIQSLGVDDQYWLDSGAFDF